MFRKLIFVFCAMALTLASCGRQITPNRPGTSGSGLQAGFMEVKFNTYQAMNFTSTWYVIALDTDGSGIQPYPVNGNQQQNWRGYSFEIIVYQLQGQAGPQAALIQFVTQQNLGGGGTTKVPTQPLTYAPQQLQLIPNCNGAQTQFCVLIDRHLFSGLTQASPSASPSATPSASPSASPSSSPSASPSPPAISGLWNVNWFTVNPTGGPQAGGQVIDAPGPLGVNDQTWTPPNTPNGVYDTSTSFDSTWTAISPPGWPQVTPAEAQIAGGEVLNAP